MRQLVDAIMIVGSDLDLPAMLKRIVQSAVTLADASYGALGVLDETRSRLASSSRSVWTTTRTARSATCRRVMASSGC